MMTAPGSGAERVWSAIEAEKRRDRTLRRVCVAAWVLTFAVLLIVGGLVGVTVAQAARLVLVGALSWTAVFSMAMPFIIVVGTVCLLIAVLSTVGIFLRMRMTTMSEIQLRLAALEQMLAVRRDVE
jgi:hypothetical protein